MTAGQNLSALFDLYMNYRHIYVHNRGTPANAPHPDGKKDRRITETTEQAKRSGRRRGEANREPSFEQASFPELWEGGEIHVRINTGRPLDSMVAWQEGG